MLRFKEIRTERGVSQRTVANALGVSAVVYSRYQTGARQPSADLIARFAEYFHITTDVVMGIQSAGEKSRASSLAADIAARLSSMTDDQLLQLRGYITGKYGK